MARTNKHVHFLDAAAQSLINATAVPKNRKPKFELILKIIDLNNVPLVTGSSFIKWHLPYSNAAEHRGKTSRALIKDHKVTWEYEKIIQLRVTADKNGLLQATEIHFEVLQEYSSGSRGERITLGIVKVNLSEYVEGSYEADEGIIRRYLMQESKINSTLKVVFVAAILDEKIKLTLAKLSILMKQIDGERNFVAPPLKTAPIFGGIAGIMNSEQVEPDDVGHMPTMSNKLSRDIGELQDMYRKTLAASWSSHLHELPADHCIEDIFSGGDGWGKHKNDVPTLESSENEEDVESEGDRQVPPITSRRETQNFSRRGHLKQRSHGRPDPKSEETSGASGGSGRSHPDQHAQSSSSDDRRKPARKRPEITEFDLVEDLRSWQISPP